MGTYLGDWGYGFSGGNMAAGKGPLEIARDRTSGDFIGMLDDVRIYPSELSFAQIFQRYIETKDGVSSHSIIVPQETSVGQTWMCKVIPSDGQQDGTTRSSNSVSLVSAGGNSAPRIDWYSPLTPHSR